MFDHVLRGVALAAAAGVVAVAAMNSQLPLNFSSDASTGKVETRASEQREAAAAKTRGYAYLLRSQQHRYPARWCAGEINYTIDFTMLDDGQMDPEVEQLRWQRVFQEWSEASGGLYRFVYQGQQEFTMNADGEPNVSAIEPRSIGITYVHGGSDSGPSQYQSVAVQGRTAGNGGLQVVSRGDDDADALHGDRGFVLIDVDDASELAADGLRRTLYQHESGHALGLGHVEDEDVLMNGTLSNTRSEVTPADRAGVRSLLRMPCGS